jgi:phospholipase/lecithinase/hemolysin
MELFDRAARCSPQFERGGSSMRKRLGAAVVAASFACGAAQASSYSTIYSFGDSLSDAGNIFAVTHGAIPAPSFPSGAPAYFDGRFSNGPNWVDDLSAKLGLGPVIPSAEGGNDFAVGGAQTGPTSVNPGVPLVDLNYQVQEFGVLDPSPKTGALYTLDIGANDIGNALSAYAKSPSTFDLTGFLTQAVSNTVTAIDSLYADGARDLLYYEVPDLSLVPAFEAGGPLGGDLAAAFNYDVLAEIKPLEAGGLTVFDVPIFSALQTIVDYPYRFGLTNVTSPCISGNYVAPGTECADPNQHLFWDDQHPTATGQALTADLAYNVLNGAPDPISTPEASTWAMMLIGFGGLGFAYRRTRPARAARAA